MTTEIEGISATPYPLHADLAGATVFVTGGGSGIGAWFVDAFAAQGANVCFVSLSHHKGVTLCDAVARHRGRRPWFQPCDVRDVAALAAIMERVGTEVGPIRVLINNAARDDRHTLEGTTAADWDDSLNTNLRPYFFAARAAAPAMRVAGGGSIINVGSNAANLGLTGYPAYVTAKAGIVGLTRALARELGPHDIRVNALIPGWVMTERQQARWVTPEALAECLAEQCLPRPLQGGDIAQAALFLAARASAAITGQSVIVDGGRAMS
jgi:galactose dehydrogenase